MKNSKLLLVLAASATLTLAACNNQNDLPASSESLSQSVAEKYAVNVTAHELLNISVDKTQAEAGERVTITVTPKKASVMLDAVKVNGVDLNAIGGVYSFEMPANAVTVSAEAHDRHSVTISENLPEGVRAVADKQYADAGEVVEVTLEYDETALTIQFVMAGTMFCGQKSNKVYYFVMPDGDIEILVGASQGVNHGVVNISEHANVLLPDECVSGAAVSFSFTIDLGYDFDDIEILDADGNAIAWAFDEEEPNMVNFNMPASAVSVNVKTTVGFFEIASSKEDKNIYEIAYENEGEFVRSTDGHFPFGARIRVLMKDTDEEKFSRLSLSGIGQFTREEGTVEGNYLAYYFNMPARKVGLTVEKQDLLHEIVVNKDQAAHFNFSFYTKDEDGNYIPVDGAKLYTEAYVKAELIEGFTAADYEISSLKIEYKTYTYNESSLSTNTRDLLKSSSWTTGLNEDGYYGFKLSVSTAEHMMLEGEDAKVTLTAVEKDLQIWKGKSWLGSYIGLEVGSSHGDKLTNSINVTIDGAGEYKGRSGPFLITADDVDNKVVTMSTIGASTPDTKKFAYGENLILTHDYPQDTVLGTSADWLVAVKKASADDADAEYTVKAEHFGVNDNANIYGAVQFFHNGEAYANAFIDYTGGKYYIDGVTFNFRSGNYVTDDNVNYDVVVNGVTIASFGTKAGATGYNNRVALDGYQGEYDILDGDNHVALFLDGTGKAVYGEDDYSYTLGENNHILVTRVENTDLGAVTYNGEIALDVAAKTGTLVSMEHNEPEVLVYDLNSEVIKGTSTYYTYTRGRFVKDEENNQYVVNNIPEAYGVYEMAIQVGLAGQLSFDFKCGQYVSYSSYYVHGTVYKNGVVVPGYEHLGGTAADPKADHIELIVEAGDIIQIAVVSNTSYYSPSYQQAIVSNINFVAPGAEAGLYEGAQNDTVVKLDGFGHGKYGEVSFDYTIAEGAIENVALDPAFENIDGTWYKVIRTLSFNVAEKTVVDNPEMTALHEVTPSISYSASNPFTEADGVYTSGNKGVNSSTSTMTITADQAGLIMFDFETEGEGGYDYMTITRNGNTVVTSKTSGSSSNRLADSVMLEVNANDTIEIKYQKDSSSNVGLDCAIISNLHYFVA